MKNSVKNFHINNKCAVLVLSTKNCVDVMFPACLLAKTKIPATNVVYKTSEKTIDVECLCGDTINRATIKNVPPYVVRPIILSDIAIKAKQRNINGQLIFVVSDKYYPISFANMLDIELSNEDYDKEQYLIGHLSDVYMNKFASLRSDVQEGCQILFNCCSNGGKTS